MPTEPEAEAGVESNLNAVKEKVDADLDPNLPEKPLDFEDSPYAEVRASVPPTDNPDMPCNTVRVWIIGMIFVTFGSALNMFFSMRSPSISISSIVALLLSWFLGRAWSAVMPTREFTTFGKKWTLNHGPFNIKEHTVITIMSNVSFGGGQAYATSALIAQQHWYGQYLGWTFQILVVWSSQVIGYGLAGAARRYLVWPASMIWPGTLVYGALFHTLHKDHEVEVPNWSISRYKWYMTILGGAFVW